MTISFITPITWYFFPFHPMEYHFMDDLYDNLHKGERVQVQLLFICECPGGYANLETTRTVRGGAEMQIRQLERASQGCAALLLNPALM